MASYNTVIPPTPESKNPIFITFHAFYLIFFYHMTSYHLNQMKKADFNIRVKYGSYRFFE
ncbi:hypothetical protein BSB_39560 [Bacillus stercoris]|nr:hypothetical protein BSB_39560 [Bacillus stercoris]